MAELGVINTPDYWRGITSVEHLGALFTKAVKPGKLDKRIENGITKFETALSVLVDSGIVNSPEYWRAVAGSILHVNGLLINMANRARIVLEKIIYAEARGEPSKGQIAVGNVIMNRHRSPFFPDGIYNVVSQSKPSLQFTPTVNGAYDHAVPSYSVKRAADAVLDGKDVSHGALFFCTRASAARPGSWHENGPHTLAFLFELGNHRFYK
jgi:hypothetical protein